MAKLTPFDRERDGYQRQAFTFHRLAQEAATEKLRDLWRAAESQMKMASLANAPEIAAHHVSSAALFARTAQSVESRLANPSPPPEAPAETIVRESRRKAAQAVINEKRERTRFENLKKKFGAPPSKQGEQ